MSTWSAAGPVFRLLLRHGMTWLAWFWAVVAAVLITIGVLLESFGTLDQSVWEDAGAAPRWALFVVGILFASTYLPFLVAHGVTRRAVTVAGAAAGGVLALTAAVAMQVGYLVERAAFVRIDRAQFFEDHHLFRVPTQAHLMLTEYALLFAAYLLSGWLVGVGYYRFGGWLGTLFLVPAMVPTAGVDVLLGTGWTDTVLYELHLGADNRSAAIGLSLVVLAVGLAAVHAVTRTVSIKPRTT